ncbi:MAG: hypothetical protein AAF198_05910 [Pseudomonadota bacterium]
MRRWFKFCLAIALAAVLFTQDQLVLAENQAATAEDFSKAAKVAKICGEFMPNNEQAEAEILKLGFVTERWNGRFHILKSSNQHVLVIISGADTYDKHCGILVDNMSADQAETLVMPWLDTLQATRSTLGNSLALKRWSGLKDGVRADASVFETSHHETIEGAWVRLVLTDKPID